MNTVVIESIRSGRREEIEVRFALKRYSTFTFNVIEKIGIIPIAYGRGRYFCRVLIYPQGNDRPPILTSARLIDSIDGVDGALGYLDFVEVADPFSVPWKTYLQLPIEGVERLTQRARDEDEVWIRKQIEEYNAEWILVVNRRLIRWSRNRKDYPLEEELTKIAEEYNLFPFIFFRPPLIEESSWAPTKYEHDYYPTINISIGGKLDLVGDLDTGSPITTLDMDRLISLGILHIHRRIGK